MLRLRIYDNVLIVPNIILTNYMVEMCGRINYHDQCIFVEGAVSMYYYYLTVV